jgi:type IV pilus assembly protein PilE
MSAESPTMPRTALEPRRPLARAMAGFTIIELMIVVIIIGVLAAVALPSFFDSIRKGRRSEAFAAIAAVQQAQERWRSNNPEYTNSLSSLVIGSPTRPGGYYSLTVSDSGAVAYVVRAEAVSGTSQVNDGDCAKLAVKVERGNVSYASCASCTIASATFTNTNKCWAK